MYMYVCGHEHATVYLWRSDDNRQKLVLSFHHFSPRDQTQGFRLGGKWLCPLKPPLASDFAHWATSPALEVWGFLSVYCLGFSNSYFMDLVFSLRVLRQSRDIVKTILELISPGWPLADRNPLASASRALQWQVKSRHKTQLVLVFHPLYHTVSCSYYPMRI